MKFKKILLVSHITDLSGPTEALENFLRKHSEVLGIIYHPFHYCTDRRSEGRIYYNGQLLYDKRLIGMSMPQLLTFLKDVLLTLYFLVFFKKRFDIYLGVDPLNTMVGIILKRICLVKFVVFYTIDWMPHRFSNRFLNTVYHAIDRFCVRGCDASWNISPRIVKIRQRQGLADSKNILVPVGVEVEKIKLQNIEKKTVRRLVLLGALAPSKGVDLIIEAFPAIKDKCPDIELYVIGKTPQDPVENGIAYEPYEERLMKMGNSVKLLGPISHDKVLEILPDFDIGLAPYKPDTNNLSQWADPSRVKDYLACGLPVIITDVPEIAKDVQEFKAGILIKYNIQELVNSVYLLYSNSEMFKNMRMNALRYMENYTWDRIFTDAFNKSILDGK